MHKGDLLGPMVLFFVPPVFTGGSPSLSKFVLENLIGEVVF